MNGEGYDWDERKWKNIVKQKVSELGVSKWRKGIVGKSTLKWYSMKDRPRYESFYDGGWSSELLFKARSQSLELNART